MWPETPGICCVAIGLDASTPQMVLQTRTSLKTGFGIPPGPHNDFFLLKASEDALC